MSQEKENEDNKPMTFKQFRAFVICGAIMYALFYSSTDDMGDCLMSQILSKTLGWLFEPIFNFGVDLFPNSLWVGVPVAVILCGITALALLWTIANLLPKKWTGGEKNQCDDTKRRDLMNDVFPL